MRGTKQGDQDLAHLLPVECGEHSRRPLASALLWAVQDPDADDASQRLVDVGPVVDEGIEPESKTVGCLVWSFATEDDPVLTHARSFEETMVSQPP